jgi:hypothetical protein
MKSIAFQIVVAVAFAGIGAVFGYMFRDMGANREALRVEQGALKAQRQALGSEKREAKARRKTRSCEKQRNASRKREAKAQREALACEKRATELRQALANPDVDQLYGLLQYCCDWPRPPLSEEQESCRHLLFGDNGDSTFRGEVRWWGGTRPSGPPPRYPQFREID